MPYAFWAVPYAGNARLRARAAFTGARGRRRATEARLLAVWFDGDAAGREAAQRLSDRATAAGIPVRPWLFPEGMDAGDAWRQSPDALRRAIRDVEAA